MSIIAITIAPSTALRIVPRPPNRLVPPITAAAIEYSRIVPPPVDVSTDDSREASTMPPNAAIVEEIMNTMITTRETLMPARRAASTLPPTAYTWRPKLVRVVTNVHRM